MSHHFPRLCHDSCLIKYVVPDYHTRVSGRSSAKACRTARIVSTVECFLCCLNAAGLRTVCSNACNGSSSCRWELSCLIYYTVNAARISAGSHTVHDNRTDCKLSFVLLAARFALDEAREQLPVGIGHVDLLPHFFFPDSLCDSCARGTKHAQKSTADGFHLRCFRFVQFSSSGGGSSSASGGAAP